LVNQNLPEWVGMRGKPPHAAVPLHRCQRTERDVIHVNLCLSLLTAELLFLFGIEQTAGQRISTKLSVGNS